MTNNTEILKELFNDYSPLITRKGSEAQFFCPFCNHHKRKLSVNVYNGKWHCWVCGKSGISYRSLLRKIHAPYKFYSLLNISNTYKSVIYNNSVLKLPEEYISFKSKQEFNSIAYRHAIYYCKSRGLTEEDIIRYNIGYCTEGKYANRIIIPSYDINNNLNFFCGRDYLGNCKYKYLLCDYSKNIIGFEKYTDFRYPITLVEGVFDAFGVKYNVIPLFGKTLSDRLKEKIIHEIPPQVNVLLDNDAFNESLNICEFLINNNIKCNLVLLDGKDPNELGHQKTWECISKNNIVTKKDLMILKIKNVAHLN